MAAEVEVDTLEIWRLTQLLMVAKLIWRTDKSTREGGGGGGGRIYQSCGDGGNADW